MISCIWIGPLWLCQTSTVTGDYKGIDWVYHEVCNGTGMEQDGICPSCSTGDKYLRAHRRFDTEKFVAALKRGDCQSFVFDQYKSEFDEHDFGWIRMTRFLPYVISRYRDEGIMGIDDSSTSGRLLGMSWNHTCINSRHSRVVEIRQSCDTRWSWCFARNRSWSMSYELIASIIWSYRVTHLSKLDILCMGMIITWMIGLMCIGYTS